FFGAMLWGEKGPIGPLGMMAGAAIIFFAYLGFDAVSTQAEEAKNPKRDIPIGIIGSLLICTLLYIFVAAVLSGMVNTPALIEGKGTKLTDKGIEALKKKDVPDEVLNALEPLKGQEFPTRKAFEERLASLLSEKQLERHKTVIVDAAIPPEYN